MGPQTMEKKAYIIPTVSVHQLNLSDGILLGTSNTPTDNDKAMEVKEYHDWDIWDE